MLRSDPQSSHYTVTSMSTLNTPISSFHSCSYVVMFWYSLWCNHVWCGPQTLLTGPHSLPTPRRASSLAQTPTRTLLPHSYCVLAIMDCHLELCAAVCNKSSTTTNTHGQGRAHAHAHTHAAFPPHNYIKRLQLCIVTLICTLQSPVLNQRSPATTHAHTHMHPLTYMCTPPNSKVHGANMGPIWGRQDPGGPHVGPMNFAIWACIPTVHSRNVNCHPVVNHSQVIIYVTVHDILRYGPHLLGQIVRYGPHVDFFNHQ